MSRYSALLQDMMDTLRAGDSAAPFATPDSHLDVYVEGYRSRLQQVLEGAYPALLHYIGKQAFDAAALRYIAAHPSRHFNLERYPVGFAACLTQCDQPARELAQLESAIAEVYLTEESPPLTAAWCACQTPETLADTVFTLRTAARLLAFRYSVDDYLSALREGHSPAALAQATQYLLVLRHRNTVLRHRLEEGEYALLALLADGYSVSAALDGTAMSPYTCDPGFAITLTGWFARWAGEGFLTQPEE
jgi:hypothetical protein